MGESKLKVETPLKVGWATSYPVGAVIDAAVVETPVAKANGWPDQVVPLDEHDDYPWGKAEETDASPARGQPTTDPAATPNANPSEEVPPGETSPAGIEPLDEPIEPDTESLDNPNPQSAPVEGQNVPESGAPSEPVADVTH